MQHRRNKDLDVEIILKGRQRFLWKVKDRKGDVYAQGEAVTVAAAKTEAGFTTREV
jgi:hypothetical protein